MAIPQSMETIKDNRIDNNKGVTVQHAQGPRKIITTLAKSFLYFTWTFEPQLETYIGSLHFVILSTTLYMCLYH